MTAIETVGRWYTYEFPRQRGVCCALGPACTIEHPVYIGKTNEPWRRHFEHLKDKGWIESAAGYVIHERTYATEAECLAAEKAMILARLPLANEQHNMANPHRLVFDHATVRQPVAKRVRSAVRPKATQARRRWTRGQKRSVGIVAGWATLTAALAVLAAWGGLPAVTWQWDAPLTAAALVLAAWTRTRRRKAISRQVGAWLAIVALGWVGWTLLPADIHARLARLVPAAQSTPVPVRSHR